MSLSVGDVGEFGTVGELGGTDELGGARRSYTNTGWECGKRISGESGKGVSFCRQPPSHV
jgi:hypothetical protein